MPKPLSGYDWPTEFPKNEPTILASDSWDWLPTIRDRDTGIWNHVRLTATGDVTVENAFASTHFPEAGNLSRADVTLKLDLKNHSARPCKGELKVRLGEIEFTHPVTLDADETKSLTLDKSTYQAALSRQSQAVVAQRPWRAEPLRSDARIQLRRQTLGRKQVAGRHPRVQLQPEASHAVGPEEDAQWR